MSLDLDRMKEIAERIYLKQVVDVYGDDGIKAFHKLIENIRELYKYIAPEKIEKSLIVINPIQDFDISGNMSSPIRLSSFDSLIQTYDFAHNNCIYIQQNGDILLWSDPSIELVEIAKSAIVYIYKNRQDSLFIKNDEVTIPNPEGQVHASVFSVPTFRALEDALDFYKCNNIRTSRCDIFSTTWHQKNRLFFAKKPEEIMRNSLIQFLQTTLRSAETRPEQNVDESHPIDIKVTWNGTNRLSLIEIKWLGKSLTKNERFTVYSPARARDGAKQLADYLDSNRTQTPTHLTRGYLVVIDARRRGLTPSSASVNRDNGFWYLEQELDFDPEYHNIRDDFGEPIRMFAEPICSPN